MKKENNSCIYISKIRHKREKPAKNNFSFSLCMFYIDLDELEMLEKKYSLFSYNKWNIFSFYDKDHFTFINNNKKYAQKISKEKVNYTNKNYLKKNTKERIKEMIKELKLGFVLGKVYLLTNLRNFGYVFNPVSFYFCYDKKGKFRAMFSEVNNTFHDQKMFYIKIDNPDDREFHDKQRKNFYISPFIDYDTDIHWKFKVPDKELNMNIDSVKGDGAILKTYLTGERKEITNSRLSYLIFRYPFMTFMIIFYIHYQALKLWMKKVSFFSKEKTDKKIYEVIGNKEKFKDKDKKIKNKNGK